jgi:hypothetical protein
MKHHLGTNTAIRHMVRRRKVSIARPVARFLLQTSPRRKVSVKRRTQIKFRDPGVCVCVFVQPGGPRWYIDGYVCVCVSVSTTRRAQIKFRATGVSVCVCACVCVWVLVKLKNPKCELITNNPGARIIPPDSTSIKQEQSATYLGCELGISTTSRQKISKRFAASMAR